MKSMFGPKSEKSLIGRPILVNELKSIYFTFMDRCQSSQLTIPSKFETEMNRRIKDAEKSSAKAKLTLNNCELDDQHLIFLIEALASSPVLTKLDISGNNITDKGASYIGRLLKGQIKLVRTVPIDKRLNANFLGSVDIGNPPGVSDRVLQDLQKYTRILTYCTAQIAIRKFYIDQNSPTTISPELFQLFWKEMIGKSPNRQLLHDTVSLYASHETYLTFDECEVAILQELQESGTIPVLSLDEYLLFKSEKEIEELTPFRLRKGDDVGSDVDEFGGDSSPTAVVISPPTADVSPPPPTLFNESQHAHLISHEPSNCSEINYDHHPQSNLFSLIDRNSDGRLTLVEFIQALRTQPTVSKALCLPRVIKQEDGTRDQCVRAFNDMDSDNSGTIDRRKFLLYLDQINSKHKNQANIPPLSIQDNSTVSTTRAFLQDQETSSISEEGDNEECSSSSGSEESQSDKSRREKSADSNIKSNDSITASNELESHPQSNLFSLIDRNSDGRLTLAEFIQALRTQPTVSKALCLPRVIKQEDGTRDQCVRAFNDMDSDNSGTIDRRKFLLYLDQIQNSQSMNKSNTLDDDVSESSNTTISSNEESVSDSENESQDGGDASCEIEINRSEKTIQINVPLDNDRSLIPEQNPPLVNDENTNQNLIQDLQRSSNKFVTLTEFLGLLKPLDQNFTLRDQSATLFRSLRRPQDPHSSVLRSTLVDYLKANNFPGHSPPGSPIQAWQSFPIEQNQPSKTPRSPTASTSPSRFQKIPPQSRDSKSIKKSRAASGSKESSQHNQRNARKISGISTNDSIITPMDLGENSSYYPLQDDPQETEEIATSTSMFSNGKLLACALQLTSLEVPDEVTSLIYQQYQEMTISRKIKPPTLDLVHTIVLSHNLIESVSFENIRQFHCLIHLDLSFNRITSILEPFPSNLVSLKLNRNKIRSLDGLLLCQSLRELNVSHNEIKNVEGLPSSLQKLDISYNHIDGDLNLRLLGFCQSITVINIDQNPVVFRLKNWRVRLLSLLPKLEQINHEHIPRVRRVPETHKLRRRQANSSLRSPSPRSRSRRLLSPQKPRITPNKMKKSEQQAHDELRYKEYEQLRHSREKLEKDMNKALKALSNSIHKKPLPEEHLINLSIRLNKWRPPHIKRLEENEKKRKELENQQKHAALNHSGASPLRKSPRRNQVPPSIAELKYQEEIKTWMQDIQQKLSGTYDLICRIFHEVQLALKEIYQQNTTSLTTSSAPLVLPLDQYRESIDQLLQDITPFKISYDLIPRYLIEDCIGWNEDVGYCLTVLKVLKVILSMTSQFDGIQMLGDCLSDIVTSLQIGEDGQPLEFVAWKAGSSICNVISAGLSSPRHHMNLSSFSPINKAEMTVPELPSTFDEGDSVKYSVSVFGPPNSPFKVDDNPSSPQKAITSDIDARMENLKLRALQRAGLDPSSPKKRVPSPSTNLSCNDDTTSAFQEVKRSSSSGVSPLSYSAPVIIDEAPATLQTNSMTPQNEDNHGDNPKEDSISSSPSEEREQTPLQPAQRITPPSQSKHSPPPSQTKSLISSLHTSLEELGDEQEQLSPLTEIPSQQKTPYLRNQSSISSQISQSETVSSNKPNELARAQSLMSFGSRQNSTQEDIDKDHISATNLFTRMGSLKEKIMRSSTRNMSSLHEEDIDNRSRSMSNVSSKSGASDLNSVTYPTPSSTSIAKKLINPNDENDESDSSSIPHETKSISSQASGSTSLSALERLKLKVQQSKLAKANE